MKLDNQVEASENSKRSYKTPDLVVFGDAKEMTRNVNEVGPGDALFSVLRHS